MVLREGMQAVTSNSWCGSCGKIPIGQGVTMRRSQTLDGSTVAGYAGLLTCGSVWLCSVCSAKIARRRKQELERVICAAVLLGAHVSLLTLTVRHRKSHSLTARWNVISYAWNATMSGAGSAEFKQQLGMIGWVKTVELTHGPNGWHVHLHVVVISERDPRMTYVTRMKRGELIGAMSDVWIADRWGRALARKGFDFVKDRGGLDWRAAEAGRETELSDYVTKTGLPSASTRAAKTPDGLAKEATLGALKKGRTDHRTPLQILADLIMFGDASDLALWQEYEEASHGRRQMSWSSGLRDWADLGEEETDEEIAERDYGGEDVIEFSNDVWTHEISPVSALLLTMLERDGLSPVLTWLDDRHIPYTIPPPDDPSDEDD